MKNKVLFIYIDENLYCFRYIKNHTHTVHYSLDLPDQIRKAFKQQ